VTIDNQNLGDRKILRRVTVVSAVEREIWAKAAGRCALCATYLLTSSWEYGIFAAGQVAHIVGATDAKGSPRGDSPLSGEERAAAANLMLLCYPCHKKADLDPEHYSCEYLIELKNEFEERVREVTNFASLEPTIVVRLTSPIRGHAAAITDAQVSESLRYSHLTYAGEDVRSATERIALDVPEDVEGIWTTAVAQIEKKVDRAVRTLEEGSARSLSVFALAPIPLLVKLGHRIGTKHSTHVFERHRIDGDASYRWPDEEDVEPYFSVSAGNSDPAATDVAAFVSISAPVQSDRAPTEVQSLPIIKITVSGGPRPGLLQSPSALRRFAQAWREALQQVEELYPHVQRVHLLAATPVAASIELGRHLMHDAHPRLVVYQLDNAQRYVRALTVG
jgi:hypothetical protein